MPIKVNIPEVGAVNFPDGMSEDEVHRTVDSIYSQFLAAKPPAAASGRPNMRTSALGYLAPQKIERSKAPNSQEGFPGFEGSYGDPEKAMAMSAAGLEAGEDLALGGGLAAQSQVFKTLASLGLVGKYIKLENFKKKLMDQE
jgi:hypothetical protein